MTGVEGQFIRGTVYDPVGRASCLAVDRLGYAARFVIGVGSRMIVKVTKIYTNRDALVASPIETHIRKFLVYKLTLLIIYYNIKDCFSEYANEIIVNIPENKAENKEPCPKKSHFCYG